MDDFGAKVVGAALKASDNKCFYCLTPLDKNNLSFDHVKSKKMGGGDQRWNCKSACRTCNARKGIMTAFEFFKNVMNKKPRCLALTSRKKDCKRSVAKGNRKFCVDHEKAKSR